MVKFCGSLLIAFSLTVFIGTPCHAQAKIDGYDSGKITIIFEPVFKDKPLMLHDQYYVDDNNDTLYIDAFRFYMTNFQFDCGHYQKEIHATRHLFDASDTATYTITFDPTPGWEYRELNFTAGVDSVINTSGANEGDLDPVKGMYWTWNSGYIMAKLEGRSAVCKTLHHEFEFHIGGYKSPYNTDRKVYNLPTSFLWEEKSDLSNIHFPQIQTHAVIIRIKTDVSAWFRGISLAKTNNIVIPGKEAAMMADNYAKMFSIVEIKRY